MAYKFENITVLIIESSHAMFDLTKSVLVAFGVNQVYSAFDYKHGFQNFCQINPDLVIMDWLDDPLNALALTRKIRSDPSSPNPFVPIILMSGYSLKERVLRARDSGITCFMAKPYTARALYNRIEQLVEKPRQFVKSEDFFGPDRRHERGSTYGGLERRTEPPSIVDLMSSTSALSNPPQDKSGKKDKK